MGLVPLLLEHIVKSEFTQVRRIFCVSVLLPSLFFSFLSRFLFEMTDEEPKTELSKSQLKKLQKEQEKQLKKQQTAERLVSLTLLVFMLLASREISQRTSP
jgi:hypothetical protein